MRRIHRVWLWLNCLLPEYQIPIAFRIRLIGAFLWHRGCLWRRSERQIFIGSHLIGFFTHSTINPHRNWQSSENLMSSEGFKSSSPNTVSRKWLPSLSILKPRHFSSPDWHCQMPTNLVLDGIKFKFIFLSATSAFFHNSSFFFRELVVIFAKKVCGWPHRIDLRLQELQGKQLTLLELK